ncbi:MAG: DUF1616 domain-containing protein [Thermoleophilia bacterium]|nr:DUF1616 domain-containing protein [Thermoleophilia bacterium]
MPDLKAAHSRKSYLIPIILSVAVIVLCIFFYASGSVPGFLSPFVSKQSEQFTELYFTDYEEMPKFVEVGRSYPVGFTIVNHENRGEAYEYRATAVEGSLATVLETASLYLNNEEKAERQIVFTPSKTGEKSKLVIELVDRNQEITFTMQSIFQ